MSFTSITIEGGMFPPDLLDRVAAADLDGQRPADFGLSRNDRLSDQIQSAFSDVRAFWDSFQRRAGHSSDSLTTLTREFWMLPVFEALGFRGSLGLTYQQSASPAGGDTFFISHRAGEDPFAPPVHIVALGQDLGTRPARTRRSPHATVQEFLNRSDALWGIVTNGERLRLLRNSTRISRPTYLEFDLRGMIEGNLYNEFAVFYRLLHRSRLPRGVDDAPESLLERYYTQGIEDGGRVRENLREGVEQALEGLGTAFLQHPDNQHLRDAIASGRPNAEEYYRELLRLIYRMLFLFVAEERGLLFVESTSVGEGPVPSPDPSDVGGHGVRPYRNPETVSSIYTRYYSLSRLRNRCERPFQGDRFNDLWAGLVQTFRIFRFSDQAESLGLTALNGELFGSDACKNLEEAACANEDLLQAIFNLSTFYDRDGNVRRRVNYAALDVEELGSVYESLLDYKPAIQIEAPATFALATGGERKQTGSYYTPPSLVAELITSALEPVIEERLKNAEKNPPLPESGEGPGVRADSTRDADHLNLARRDALLSMRVIDPASGSGHFLLAAARRIAREVARIDSGEPEPPPEIYRRALREVIRRCIYAVDKNPLAVDLCKVALWLEGHEPGKPLSFLDHHIKHGDSLIGVMDLQVLEGGIPNDAYKRDDRAEHRAGDYIRKRNQTELKGQRDLFGSLAGVTDNTDQIAREFDLLREQQQTSPADVDAVTHAYQRIRQVGSDWHRLRVAADLWTSAFFADLSGGADALVPTTDTVRRALNGEPVDERIVNPAFELSETVPFFHWPLEFMDVFDDGGFDVVLGNPPWERIKLQEKEFFAGRDAEIANAPNKAARQRLIDRLPESNSILHREFRNAIFQAEAASRFARGSGRFVLSGRGDINTYALFTEQMRQLIAPDGRGGMIVPSGIATDDTTKLLFQGIMDDRSIASMHHFDNRKKLFPAVGSMITFVLLTLTGTDKAVTSGSKFSFFSSSVDELEDGERIFILTPEDLRLLNPNTRTCPIFRTRRDAEITKAIYRRVPVLVDENKGDAGNPWETSIRRVFDMNKTSTLALCSDALMTSRESDQRPMYEAKLTHQFDHRWATYEAAGTARELHRDERDNPAFTIKPRYWIKEHDIDRSIGHLLDLEWLLGWRDICRSTDERTVIAAAFPKAGTDFTLRLALSDKDQTRFAIAIIPSFNSFVFDYIARQKIGGTHLSDYISKQLPVLPPHSYQKCAAWNPHQTVAEFIQPRVLELTYTAWDMQPFAQDCGYHGPPFRWDDERRFLLRCELDAAFFHLYGIERDDVDYIMETFPIVKRKDIAAHNEYRTKRVILEIYDAMSHAIHTATPYQTRLDPPPADPSVAHGANSVQNHHHVRDSEREQ